ncbi:MAG: DUF5655 domain-containing protein [bacterium]|nr:DUF5655 domain-containing protein [bacterium]
MFLLKHPELNEKWVQERIAEDPSILGLGDLVLRDKEKRLPHSGRLDLLCQDPDSNWRYEIEIQLGKTDESHIIRTIEYWDVERKRYPQYDHTAVLVAEDITSRFLNVIGLLNGVIPFVAIQVRALQIGDQVSLVFTTVLNEMKLGPDEDDEPYETADRAYWEKRATKATVEIADDLLPMIREIAPGLSLKYNKFYIGLAKDGAPNNFVVFRPKKGYLRFEPRLESSEEVQKLLDDSGIDVMEYDARWGRYRIRLEKKDVVTHENLIRGLMKRAYGGAEE